MRNRDRFDDYDWVLYDDDDDDDDLLYDDDEDDDEDDEDEDAYSTLQYLDEAQIESKSEIIRDIYLYLRQYQPDFKIIKRKDM